MATGRDSRFSPVHSDFGDRALSPALSASSHATSSLPTDMSDISSLDGEEEEFEVIEAPRSDVSDEQGSSSHRLSDSYDDLGQRDGRMATSSFLSVDHPFTSQQETDGTFRVHDDLNNSRRSAAGMRLPTRNSLTTLCSSMEIDGSTTTTTTSQLHFPDPLGDSFQHHPEIEVDEQTLMEEPNDTRKSPDEEQGQGNESTAAAQNTMELAAEHTEDIKEEEDSTKHATRPTLPPYNSIPLPAIGFPFKIDRGMLASKAFRALLGLIVVLWASGVMPVWNTGSMPTKTSKLSVDTPPSYGTSMAPSDSLLPTMIDKLSAKASKGLIVLGGEPSSGPRLRNARRKVCSAAAEPRARSKELSVVAKANRDLIVYSAEAYSSLAMDWLSSAPSKVSAIDLSVVKGQRYFDSAALSQRLDRSSRNAKILTNRVQGQWTTYVDALSRNVLKPLAQSLVEEGNLLSAQVAHLSTTVPPKMNSLLATLQKRWHVWVGEMMRAYSAFIELFAQELNKARGDFATALRTTQGHLRKLSTRVQDMARCSPDGHDTFSARRRLQMASLLRRQKQMMALLEQQRLTTPRSAKLLNGAKAALYKTAIDSGRLRLWVEDAIGQATCPSSKPKAARSSTASRFSSRRTIGSTRKARRNRSKAFQLSKSVKRARRRADRAFSKAVKETHRRAAHALFRM